MQVEDVLQQLAQQRRGVGIKRVKLRQGFRGLFNLSRRKRLDMDVLRHAEAWVGVLRYGRPAAENIAPLGAVLDVIGPHRRHYIPAATRNRRYRVDDLADDFLGAGTFGGVQGVDDHQAGAIPRPILKHLRDGMGDAQFFPDVRKVVRVQPIHREKHDIAPFASEMTRQRIGEPGFARSRIAYEEEIVFGRGRPQFLQNIALDLGLLFVLDEPGVTMRDPKPGFRPFPQRIHIVAKGRQGHQANAVAGEGFLKSVEVDSRPIGAQRGAGLYQAGKCAGTVGRVCEHRCSERVLRGDGVGLAVFKIKMLHPDEAQKARELIWAGRCAVNGLPAGAQDAINRLGDFLFLC
ncbi:MAG: hypothetical protein ACLQUZ_12775 [Rhizomicrobium sp.]